MASKANPPHGPAGGPTNKSRVGGNGNVPGGVRPRNPYASKKPKSSTTSNSIGNNGNSKPVQVAPERRKQPPQQSHFASSQDTRLSGMEAFAGSSFSQAFGSIEDTDYFRNSVAEAQMEHVNAAERAEQRALEEGEPAISDRDHHALLQPHVLSVSTKQRGNGVLNYIRNVPFAYSRMVPDYLMSSTSCALFLSCKYHSLHPQYIHRRIAELRTDFKLRVLLVLVDLDDNSSILLFLNKLAVQQNFTLVLAWTEEEAARYLESYKALDGNDASLIQRKEKTNFVDQAADFLAGATGVNKTDTASLLTQFGSVKAIMSASQDELGMVPGLGQVKVTRLHDAFHKPFSTKQQRERKKEASGELDETTATTDQSSGHCGEIEGKPPDAGVEDDAK